MYFEHSIYLLSISITPGTYLLITFLKLLSTIYLPIYFYISLLVMGVPHQKIYFGNWMLYSLLSETFTGNFFIKYILIILKEIFFKNCGTNSRPDPEFAEHLNQRLKMMACDMIDSCIKRTDASFQNHLKKGILLNPTDYVRAHHMFSRIL